MSMLLQAENEYHDAVKNAVKRAENYADNSKKRQAAYIEILKSDWDSFETDENAQLDKTLADDEQKLETEMEELKKHLKISQEKKADMISERLKEEVLSLYGNR